MTDTHVLTIRVGREICRFNSFPHWVNTAQRKLANCGVHHRRYIALDTRGRVCVMGREFMRARDEDTFPIVVYAIDEGDAT